MACEGVARIRAEDYCTQIDLTLKCVVSRIGSGGMKHMVQAENVALYVVRMNPFSVCICENLTPESGRIRTSELRMGRGKRMSRFEASMVCVCTGGIIAGGRRP